MAPDPRRLEQLLDEFRIEELLSLVTLEEIADAWCRYQTRPHIQFVEDEDPDWWAVELLMESSFTSDEARLRATLDLILERADEEKIFGVFAAGLLEDFVKGYDEDRRLDRWASRVLTAVQRGAPARPRLVAPARGLRSDRTRGGRTAPRF